MPSECNLKEKVQHTQGKQEVLYGVCNTVRVAPLPAIDRDVLSDRDRRVPPNEIPSFEVEMWLCFGIVGSRRSHQQEIVVGLVMMIRINHSPKG